MIVVPVRTGELAGHLLRDGSRSWRVKQQADKPLASDADRIFVAGLEAIVALDVDTGARLWRVGLGGPPTAPPLAHAGWVFVAAAGELVALRAVDGQVIWRTAVGPVEFRPAVDGDLLIAAIVDGDLLGLDVPTGTERWRRDLGSSPSEPYAGGGRVYIGSREKKFFALDASSGRIESAQFVGAVVMGRATADESHVYYAALDNALWAVDRRHGAIKWRRPLQYRPAAGPVVIAAHVLVPGPVQSLPTFSARTGDPAGTIAFPESLAALPLLDSFEGGLPFAVAVTGSLVNKYTLSLFIPSPVPEMPVLPLKELPGQITPLPTCCPAGR